MKNILVVDDNKDICNALAVALGEHLRGSSIQTAINAKKGEEILNAGSIDLVVADLDMPIADGLALIEYVKKNFPDISLCVMTGACSPQVAERLRGLGVKKWIEKPFQLEELVSFLTSMVKERDD